jgi:hypothetical protein
MGVTSTQASRQVPPEQSPSPVQLTDSSFEQTPSVDAGHEVALTQLVVRVS